MQRKVIGSKVICTTNHLAGIEDGKQPPVYPDTVGDSKNIVDRTHYVHRGSTGTVIGKAYRFGECLEIRLDQAKDTPEGVPPIVVRSKTYHWKVDGVVEQPKGRPARENHTPAPWSISDTNACRIVDAEGYAVATTTASLSVQEQEDEENARRIVAAVNLCAGLTLEILEALVEQGESILKWMDASDEEADPVEYRMHFIDGDPNGND